MGQALSDLLQDQGLPVATAAQRHFNPHFRQRTNGKWSDLSDLMSLATSLRADSEHIRVTVLDELVDGPRYADRHIIDVVSRSGARFTNEVFVFATLDSDGRFMQIDEVTLAVTEQDQPFPDDTH